MAAWTFDGELNNPDNLTVRPRGGLLLCEDGSGVQYLRGLTRNGDIFDFAINQLNTTEFAGATFSPNGHTLFVNFRSDERSRDLRRREGPARHARDLGSVGEGRALGKANR